MAVGEVRINDDGTGECEYRSGGHRNDAAVAVAGAVWIGNYRWQMWPGQAEAGCEDDMRKLALCDAFDRREAQRRADEILSKRGTMVESFAEHLMEKRRADWDRFRREVDEYVSEMAAAIRDHGREAVARHLRDGTPLPARPVQRAQVRSGPQPPPADWQNYTSPIAAAAAQNQQCIYDAWQQRQGVGR
ncbi:hypothetical protein OG423_32140 [Micromonospora zamorensis]|uniref:hypothetical protein n=1 Tax=Micromonospora zamorensis TaxID=709883 RepID=UPI00352AB683|nr:hypothetical protein OG423_32140 [Micromonospora zamorensis]